MMNRTEELVDYIMQIVTLYWTIAETVSVFVL